MTQIPEHIYAATMQDCLIAKGIYSAETWARDGKKRVRMYMQMDLSPEKAADEVAMFFTVKRPKMIEPGRGFVKRLMESGACTKFEIAREA